MIEGIDEFHIKAFEVFLIARGNGKIMGLGNRTHITTDNGACLACGKIGSVNRPSSSKISKTMVTAPPKAKILNQGTDEVPALEHCE